MTLAAEVTTTAGDLPVQAALRADPGETVAVVGPNGAGKSTLLLALAGLRPLERGRVELDGVVLDDPRAGVHVHPERRAVGVVFQDRLLFPHLSVRDNVAFGLRCRRVPRREARRRADEWVARLGLAARASARPGTLSGGEAQRTALARALVGDPALLLLDEPLAALDATARVELRRELRVHLAAFPGVAVLVTHDPLDALTMGDRLAVLESGRIVQAGTTAEVCARPRSRYVAEFVGVNLFRGRADRGRITLASGARLVTAEPGLQGDAFAVVHPRAVALHRAHPEGTPRNVWSGTVVAIDPEGDRARIRVAGPVQVTAEVTAGAVAALELSPGVPVWVSVKATETAAYPA